MWVCFNDADGECWTWENHKIRIQPNITMGRIYGKSSNQANTATSPKREPSMAGGAWGPYVPEP